MDLEAVELVRPESVVVVQPVPERVMWRSCCFNMDRSFVMFFVQSVLGSSLLAFAAFRLTTEPECDRAAPYWGLIGTLCGFFFNKISNTGKSPRVARDSDRS